MEERQKDEYPVPTNHLRWSRPVGKNRTLQQLYKRRWYDFTKPRHLWKDVPLMRSAPPPEFKEQIES